LLDFPCFFLIIQLILIAVCYEKTITLNTDFMLGEKKAIQVMNVLFKVELLSLKAPVFLHGRVMFYLPTLVETINCKLSNKRQCHLSADKTFARFNETFAD